MRKPNGRCVMHLTANPAYVDVYFTLGSLYADHMKDQRKRRSL